MMRSRVEKLCYSIVASMFFANTAEKAPAEIDALAFAISRRSSNAEACHRINELESQLSTINFNREKLIPSMHWNMRSDWMQYKMESGRSAAPRCLKRNESMAFEMQ